MEQNKKYYWLKLKSDFFDDDTIKFIEEQENGIKYSNFYLKLCLKSLKTDGKLIRLVGETLIPYDINSLSKLTGVEFDTVRSAMQLFESIGLIKVLESGEIYLSQIDELIGSETDKAQMMRRLRAERKLDSNNVTQMLPEIEKEIEKDIKIEKNIKKEKNKKRKTFEEVLAENNCSEELESSIRDFIDMRKTIKKPMTSKALELLIKNLDKLTNLEEEKIAILNQSIEHGWQTVYPLKINNMRNSSKGEIKEEEKQEELKEIDISGLTTEEYDLLVKKKITIQDLIKKGRINV